jgi:hypothetical protein
MIQAAAFIPILCGSLAIVSLFSSLFELLAIRTRFAHLHRFAVQERLERAACGAEQGRCPWLAFAKPGRLEEEVAKLS